MIISHSTFSDPRPEVCSLLSMIHKEEPSAVLKICYEPFHRWMDSSSLFSLALHQLTFSQVRLCYQNF